MGRATYQGYVRQVDPYLRECLVKAQAAPNGIVLFHGRYRPKLLADLQEAVRMGDLVQFEVLDGVLVRLTLIEGPE